MGPRQGDERWGGDGGVTLRGRRHASRVGAAKAGPLGWEGGAGWPGAGALRTLKAGCLAGASVLSNKQSTTLFKMEGRAGDGPDHLISISPPQGSAGSYLKGSEDQ